MLSTGAAQWPEFPSKAPRVGWRCGWDADRVDGQLLVQKGLPGFPSYAVWVFLERKGKCGNSRPHI